MYPPTYFETERIRPNRRSTAAEGSLHLAALHGGKSDRILVTFRHSKVSFEIIFNSLNDIELIGALLCPLPINIAGQVGKGLLFAEAEQLQDVRG